MLCGGRALGNDSAVRYLRQQKSCRTFGWSAGDFSVSCSQSNSEVRAIARYEKESMTSWRNFFFLLPPSEPTLFDDASHLAFFSRMVKTIEAFFRPIWTFSKLNRMLFCPLVLPPHRHGIFSRLLLLWGCTHTRQSRVLLVRLRISSRIRFSFSRTLSFFSLLTVFHSGFRLCSLFLLASFLSRSLRHSLFGLRRHVADHGVSQFVQCLREGCHAQVSPRFLNFTAFLPARSSSLRCMLSALSFLSVGEKRLFSRLSLHMVFHPASAPCRS